MKSIENFIRNIVKSHTEKKFIRESNIRILRQQFEKLSQETANTHIEMVN